MAPERTGPAAFRITCLCAGVRVSSPLRPPLPDSLATRLRLFAEDSGFKPIHLTTGPPGLGERWSPIVDGLSAESSHARGFKSLPLAIRCIDASISEYNPFQNACNLPFPRFFARFPLLGNHPRGRTASRRYKSGGFNGLPMVPEKLHGPLVSGRLTGKIQAVGVGKVLGSSHAR